MIVLVRLVILVAFLVFGVFVALGYYLDTIVKTGIEKVGPKITGTKVSVDDVDISAMSGEGRIKGLVIGNPKGFHNKNAYELPDTTIKIDLVSVLFGTLVFEKIVIDSPEITYETTFSGNNLDTIQENVEAFGRAQGLTDRDKSRSKKKARGGTVQINHFIVKNGKINVTASLFGGGGITFSLDDIHLRDIGKQSGGVTLAQATAQALAGTTKPIFNTVNTSTNVARSQFKRASKTAEKFKGTAEKRASDMFDKAKELFGTVSKEVKDRFAK